jgi:hypothetical protein
MNLATAFMSIRKNCLFGEAREGVAGAKRINARIVFITKPGAQTSQKSVDGFMENKTAAASTKRVAPQMSR